MQGNKANETPGPDINVALKGRDMHSPGGTSGINCGRSNAVAANTKGHETI